MKNINYILVFLFFFQACSKNNSQLEDFDFTVEKQIEIENDVYSLDFLNFTKINDSLIYGYDVTKAVVFKYDNSGELIKSNRFQNGINEIDFLHIGHLYSLNKDSIFIIESARGNIILLDSELEIKNSWNIRKLVKEKIYTGGGKSQIIKFETLNNEPFITLSAGDRNYQSNQKMFFENSFLAIKVNLNTGEFLPLFQYPLESPYRQYLFWGDETPHFIYYDGEYFTSFPFDPNIYIFSEKSNEYKIIQYNGVLNKTAIGVDFNVDQGEFQKNHYIDVNHNLNDYNLISENLLSISGKKYFVRCVRKALNQKNLEIKDLNTYAISSPKHDYIIQIVDLNKKEPYKWKEYVLPQEYRNFTYIDKNGKFYFEKVNKDSEEYKIDIVSWDIND
ncbi:hypothetical protein MM213_06755 [Belliella sp. R4-6]|uniref:TolB-like 6-blade propeller-like n=1 Tax=Belliella alkalica TaxID=1730871 RepID=A0ABS9V9S7_9BACT|nr:hypothetical protein [Belliella alkalica]MCH7413176.1 hypothetical protein [Belliella alkalica]